MSAGQQPGQEALTLFEMDAGPRWAVEINEVRLFLYSQRGAGDYWAASRPRWEASGRLEVVQIGFPGDIVRLGPLGRDDAEFIRDHLLSKGAPRAAFRIERFNARRTNGSDSDRGDRAQRPTQPRHRL